jgi:hypothetical protein
MHGCFGNWAVIALGGLAKKAKVGDMGIDGRIYPISAIPKASGEAAGELDFADLWYPSEHRLSNRPPPQPSTLPGSTKLAACRRTGGGGNGSGRLRRAPAIF